MPKQPASLCKNSFAKKAPLLAADVPSTSDNGGVMAGLGVSGVGWGYGGHGPGGVMAGVGWGTLVRVISECTMKMKHPIVKSPEV